LKKDLLNNYHLHFRPSGRNWIDCLLEETPLKYLIQNLDRVISRECEAAISSKNEIISKLGKVSEEDAAKLARLKKAINILANSGLKIGKDFSVDTLKISRKFEVYPSWFIKTSTGYRYPAAAFEVLAWRYISELSKSKELED